MTSRLSPGPLTRRALLAGAALASARSLAQVEPDTALRFMRVRHQTVLVEIGGLRALVDPCFAAGLGAPALVDAPAPALEARGVGQVDIVCVSSPDVGSFDAASTRALAPASPRSPQRTSCFVSEESIAKVLRYQGYRRVRVVVPGDVFKVRDVEVRVSSSKSALGRDAVGFHFSAHGRSFWHAGAPAPLDVSPDAARFARDHAAEVVAASTLGLSIAGRAVTADADDVDILAALARARLFVRLGDDVHPTWLAGLVAKTASRPRKAKDARAANPSAGKPRLVVAVPGTWYRVRPA